jgi:alanine racemase
MARSEVTIDLGALRRNAETLIRALDGSELWAVVKADAYGHGALDCAVAALDAGASALCVATLPEATALRTALPEARILVLGPVRDDDVAVARDARLELTFSSGALPEGLPIHVKLDTGMGRWGLSELRTPTRDVVGLMTHLATADTDRPYALEQLRRFEEATAPFSGLTRHAANSAAALRLPESHLDAARCGIALYGLSPFGEDPGADGLEPVLSWRTEIAQAKLLRAGESTGYGRRFVADSDTWIGILPVGYADGLRRDLSGTAVLVEGERRPVVGAISMDATAVQLDREHAAGTMVTLVGDGLLLEEHAHVAGTITYELACGINSSPTRARRSVRGPA